jgi:hypothetical protein
MTLSLNKTGIYPHSANIMASLNKKNRIGDLLQTKKIKAMGMSACQGLCITYHLHSKAFCK